MTGDIREHWVRSGDGVRLCVAGRGEPGRPVVVLVHGYPDSKEVWTEVARRLAGRFHVVGYDVRGCGRSTAPRPLRGGFTLEKLTADFIAVTDAVSPGRPVHLAGHDWGSVQGWEFVTTAAADRIASFTSVSGPSLDHFGHWAARRRSGALGTRGTRELLGQRLRSWYVHALHTPVLPELVWRGPLARRWPGILRRLEKLPADGYPTPSLARDAAHGAWLYRDNFRPRTRRPRDDARARVPVQLVVPTGDIFLSERLYDDLGSWAPRLVRRSVDAGHWVIRTQPERIAGWITEFVLETGASSGVPATEPPAG